ncbi:P22 phage major capsid protein family protein [Amycolatopsis taiwanensis]|uniref:P22 phage major capsid protein family protein n=1 Tax=Amycolatopsis taiwanensis TaxID=342230 RepID=UPI0004888FFC|nr:P22 phage major capsid protein family protein [Amycolatopsis taiwanensis]
MANTFLTPDIIARAALANLYETTVMAPLVHRDYEPEFANQVGDTITVRKPAVFQAKEFNRAAGIEIQNATETGFPVTLNHFADVSFAVTSEDLTLKIEDFNEQLLNPAMEAISQKIDRDVLALRNDIVQEVGVVGGDNAYQWDNPRVAIDAGRVLDQKNVPMTERRLAVGPITKAAWTGDDLFNRADARGDTEGLREANLGRRVFGFDPYMTQNIVKPAQTTGNSTTEVGVAFHRTAFALVFRPLALPRGAQNAAIQSYKGFGLRVVFDYDIKLKQDVVSIDCLYGTKTLDANRAVLVKGADVA